MINIATVHCDTEEWFHVQYKYLKKHTTAPFRIFAYGPADSAIFLSRCHYVSSADVPTPTGSRSNVGGQEHAAKLNLLAAEILAQSSNDDLLMFLDGDAFPIAPYVEFAREKIKTHRLLAIRRDENMSDPQPHPSFCITTVGFWRGIHGDWQRGYEWTNARGRVTTDVGGNLLKILKDARVDWLPLLRSNRRNLHPLWFGIYGNLIYHHGAGFRPPNSRLDSDESKQIGARTGVFSKWIASLDSKLRVRRNRRLGDRMMASIRGDEEFFKALL